MRRVSIITFLTVSMLPFFCIAEELDATIKQTAFDEACSKTCSENVKGTGKLLNGKKEGLWIFDYLDGSKHASGYFVGGKRHGYWKFFANASAGGKKYYAGEFAKGKPTGIWTRWTKTNLSYETFSKTGTRKNVFVVHRTGEPQASFEKILKNGKWVKNGRQLSWANGYKFSEHVFKNGKRQAAPSTVYWSNGTVQEKTIAKSGVIVSSSFHENGTKRSESQFKGNRFRPIGTHTQWHDNGTKSSVKKYTKKSKETGIWKAWDKNGKLISRSQK